MKNFIVCGLAIFLLSLGGCSTSRRASRQQRADNNPVGTVPRAADGARANGDSTATVSGLDLVGFAETLMGIPYKYGGESVQGGFDCSGFVNYVYGHFGISVPRVTVDFAAAGHQVPLEESRPGDIILFTGSDARNRVPGHVGIITENENGVVRFIHASTSRGVMISGMNSYFLPRFLQINRISSSVN